MSIFGKKDKPEQPKTVVNEAPKVVLHNPETSPRLINSLRQLLVKPRVSEKTSILSQTGKYVFVVEKKANKVSIKKAIEGYYKVKVLRVNMIRVKGKSKTFGGKTGRTSDFKKAVVTLQAGQKIEGVGAPA